MHTRTGFELHEFSPGGGFAVQYVAAQACTGSSGVYAER